MRRVIAVLAILSLFAVIPLFGQGEELPLELGCYKNDSVMLAAVKKKHDLPSAYVDKSGLLVWDSNEPAASGKWVWHAELNRQSCGGKPKFVAYRILDQYMVKKPASKAN